MKNATSRKAVPEAANPIATRAAERAVKLREEFHSRGLFTAEMAADYRTANDVPMQVVSSAVLGAREADRAATNLVEGAKASIATPVVETPAVEPEPEAVAAPAIVEPVVAPVAEIAVETAAPEADELPQYADEHYAAAKPAPVAPALSLRDQVMARIADGIRARKAAEAAEAARAPVASRPAVPTERRAPPARPSLAPKVERQPGADEIRCTNRNCRDAGHIIPRAKAFVPSRRALGRMFDHYPNEGELIAIASCRRVFDDEDRKPEHERVRWFQIDIQIEAVATAAAERAALRAEEAAHEDTRASARAKKNLGGKTAQILAAPDRVRSDDHCVASTVPSHAPAKARGGTSNAGFGALEGWKPK